jgi:hypothetical protein
MLLNDLRYTARMLRKSPLFTLAVVFTVALGIGANTAIFSVVNAVMLRPMPFADPDRLIWVAERNDTLSLPTFATSVPNYLSWKEQARAFEQLGAFVRNAAVSSGIPFGAGNYTTTPIAATGASPLPPDTAIPIDWRIVSPGFFRTMEIPLLRGRDFGEADGPAGPQVVVANQATAQRFFGAGDPIGRQLHRVADGREFTVVGIVGDVRHTALNQESPAIYYPSNTGRVWPLMDVVVKTKNVVFLPHAL